jgi:uncharacterized protein DUF3291
MTARIAFCTLGVLKAPVGNAVVQGFVDRLASVYEAAEGSAGFFARSIRNVQTWEHSWGPVVAPKCVPASFGLNQLAMTLSVWRDLESVAAYAYRGVHGEALSKRGEWFERGPWPSFVAWWIEEHHQPNWTEAVERVDQLHAQGSTPAAFNFRQPFDSAGRPTKFSRERAELARS